MSSVITLIKKMTPRDRLLYWITERESIRRQKNLGLPRPWTNDEILSTYRFCNVRRMDDRVSKWIYNNWLTKYKDHPNMLVACTLARQLNNIESLSEVGFPETWNPDRTCKILAARAARGLKNYSAAYMVTGKIFTGRPKIETSVLGVCNPIYKLGKITDSSLEKTWIGLCEFRGLASFMAGQIVADLRWGITGRWADRHTWAPAGPGSIRGMNRFLGKPIKVRIDQAEFVRVLGEVMRFCRSELPEDITNRLEAHDYQNCLCEYDKYVRTLLGESRPKQLYTPFEAQ